MGSGSGSGDGPGAGNGFETGNGLGSDGITGGIGLGNSTSEGSGVGNVAAPGIAYGGNSGQPGGDSMLGSGGAAGESSMLGGGGPDLNNQAIPGGGQPGNTQLGSGQSGGEQSGSGQPSGGQGGSGQGGCQTAGGQPAGGQVGVGLPGLSQSGMSQSAAGQSGSGQASGMNISMGSSGNQTSQSSEPLEDTVVRPGTYENNDQQQGGYAIAKRPGEWTPSDPRHRPTKLENPRDDKDKRSRHASGDLADKRGKNWALPKSTPRSTPLVRPIRIDCLPDRLVLVPESGLSGRQEIVLDTYTSDSMDEFVSAVWHYMDNSWGIAGHDMYWKPVLKVEVAPGAERRFEDLQTLLKGSGLRVERRNER